MVAEEVGQARRVVDASPEAIRQGVRYEMSLAEARLLCPALDGLRHDATGDRRALEALGRWMTRFTPIVSAGWEVDEDAAGPCPYVLFLDVSGCGRLFGGVVNIVGQVARSLACFRVPARIAVAPTAGAAWALASCGGLAERVVAGEELQGALSPLPLEGLRLETEVVAALRRLGFRTIGQLLALPREQLPARFGAGPLLRLDQATGHRPELLVPLAYQPPVGARAEFDFPIESLDTMRVIFEGLLDQVVGDLTCRGLGARRLELVCVPDRSARRPAVTKGIPLTRACRDRKTLANLIRGGVEQLGCDRGFVAFRLNVPVYEHITGGDQATAFGTREDADVIELDRLVDRLRLRLGESAVIRPGLVESYLPERAWRDGAAGGTALTGSVRPLCLLPVPVEIRVICEPSDDRTGSPRQFTDRGSPHRLTYAIGPERISGEWWRGHDKVRDYYDVEDEAGRRFWIFRAVLTTPTRWFLHGRFQ